jgi:UPF0225 domain
MTHIMDTTHPSSRDYRDDRVAWAKELAGMVDGFDFIRLHVLLEDVTSSSSNDDDNNNSDKEGEGEAILEFQVTVRAKDDSNDRARRRRAGGAATANIAGKEMTVTETSRFIREGGRWTYAGGDIRPQVAGLEDTILNV